MTKTTCAARLVLALPALAVLLAGCPTGPKVTSLPDCPSPGAPGWQAASPPDFVHRVDGPMPPELEPNLEVARRELVAGVGGGDLDADGHVDLVLTQAGGATELFWGDGQGGFVPGDSPAEVSRPDIVDQAVAIADYDADGRPDVLIQGLRHMRLLRNLGDRAFIDVTEEVGLVVRHGVGGGLSWSDFDNDGDLDLWVGGYMDAEGVPSADALWVQDEGSFVDLWEPRRGAVGGPRAALHAVFSDWDADGDPDLLIANDMGDPIGYSHLLENVDGAIGEVDRWTDDVGPGRIPYPMGAALVDLDQDGDDDLVASDIGDLHIFERTGTWDMLDVGVAWAPEAPRRAEWISWSVVALDPDGDGRPGFLVTYGPLGDPGGGGPYQPVQPDRFFAPGADGTTLFTEDPTALLPSTPDNTRGVAVADFDEDGVADLVLGTVDGPSALYLGRCTEASRLVVVLDDGTASARTVGARVTVVAGGVQRSQELRAGGDGTVSVSEPALFFGLGDARQIDALRVTWPGGETVSYDVSCVQCKVVLPAP